MFKEKTQRNKEYYRKLVENGKILDYNHKKKGAFKFHCCGGFVSLFTDEEGNLAVICPICYVSSVLIDNSRRIEVL